MNRRDFIGKALAASAAGLLIPEYILDPPRGRSMIAVPGFAGAGDDDLFFSNWLRIGDSDVRIRGLEDGTLFEVDPDVADVLRGGYLKEAGAYERKLGLSSQLVVYDGRPAEPPIPHGEIVGDLTRIPGLEKLEPWRDFEVGSRVRYNGEDYEITAVNVNLNDLRCEVRMTKDAYLDRLRRVSLHNFGLVDEPVNPKARIKR